MPVTPPPPSLVRYPPGTRVRLVGRATMVVGMHYGRLATVREHNPEMPDSYAVTPDEWADEQCAKMFGDIGIFVGPGDVVAIVPMCEY